jgi:hypothetical protein
MALTQYETRIARALADVLFTSTDTLPDPDTAGVVERLSMYIGALDLEQAAQMRAMLVAFDVGFPVLMKAPTKRFIDASFEEQQAYVRQAEATNGNARMAFDGVRIVMLVAYTESNAVMEALGIRSRADAPSEVVLEQSAGEP